MLTIQNGDLLQSNCLYIAQQCNCFSKMGAGLAKQVKRKYPQVYEADVSFPHSPKERLGKASFAPRESGFMFNLYGQYRWGRNQRQTNYKALGYAMIDMLRKIEELENTHPYLKKTNGAIGLPYGLGSELAGGDWNKILLIIKKVLVEHGGRTVILYKLN